MNVNAQLTYKAQMKFAKKVMKWEGCSWDEAWMICTGDRQPKDPADKVKYTLGFKMCDPALELALYVQRNKNNRRQAAENFSRGLSPEEAHMFWTECFDRVNGGRMRKKMIAALKEKGNDPEASEDLSVDEASE